MKAYFVWFSLVVLSVSACDSLLDGTDSEGDSSNDAAGAAGATGDGPTSIPIELSIPEVGPSRPPQVDELNFKSFAISKSVSCGILSENDTLTCWGGTWSLRDDGSLLSGESFSQVVSEGNDACGLRSHDGRLLCTGVMLSDYTENIAEQHFSQFAKIGNLICGIRLEDGGITCGHNARYYHGPPLEALHDGPYSQIVMGSRYACALRTSDNVIECWGEYYDSNSDSAESESQPADEGLPRDVQWTHVASGPTHTCGLRLDDSKIQCWGLVGGEHMNAPDETEFETVSVSRGLTCGKRKVDGLIQCWGTFSWVSKEPLTNFQAYGAAGCGLSAAGTLLCFGGALAPPPGPELVDISEDCRILAEDRRIECAGGTMLEGPFAALSSKCGLKDDGSVHCWGNGDWGTLPRTRFSMIDSNGMNACGIRSKDGRAECWNADFKSPEYDYSGPEQIQGAIPELALKAIAVSDYYACGLRADNGHLVCWGDIPTPSELKNREYAELTADGDTGACVVDTQGDAFCWIEPNLDQAPVVLAQEFPTPIHGLADGCALDGDNRAHCRTTYEEPGWDKSSASDREFWTLDGPDEEFVTVNGPCGIRKADGRMQCFGRVTY